MERDEQLFAARIGDPVPGNLSLAAKGQQAFLAQHGRNGVPLYLYYPPRTGALPVVLPQLLTPGTVLDALAL